MSVRNHALWIAPVLALVGVLSYFMLFARWPATRDFPWVNLLLLSAAVGMSAGGLRRAWTGGIRSRAGGLLSFAVTVGLAALLCFYCFSLSYSLPPEAQALAVGDAVPAVVLPDQFGGQVDLLTESGSPLLLVFYRGIW